VSWKLNDHEYHYLTHDLYVEEIVHALKMWKHYLLSRRFELMSDHNCLQYIFEQPNLSGRQARWLVMISEFSFDIRYIKGKENKVSYSLSKWI